MPWSTHVKSSFQISPADHQIRFFLSCLVHHLPESANSSPHCLFFINQTDRLNLSLESTHLHILLYENMVSTHANWHDTPNPQPGAIQPTQDGDPQATSNPLEMSFMISHGEGSRTPHNPPIGAEEQSPIFVQWSRCTKPSRSRQNSKSNKQTRSETRSPSASRWTN